MTLAPVATGGGALTWQWLLNGVPITRGDESGLFHIGRAGISVGEITRLRWRTKLGIRPQHGGSQCLFRSPAFDLPFNNDNFANAAVINPLEGFLLR